MKPNITPKPVKIYDQNDLFDYRNSNGPARELLEGEIAHGNKIVIMQFPVNASPSVIRVLESVEDVAGWEEAQVARKTWLPK